MVDGFLKLQNGSDVRGVAAEGIEGQPVNLTAEHAEKIAHAFALWLGKRLGKSPEALRIGVGHDSRITADWMSEAAAAGICAAGGKAVNCGLASTPSMFMSLIFPETKFDGSIMITASHLPFNRNGMKFFNAEGGLEKADITEILQEAEKLEAEEAGKESEAAKTAAVETLPEPLLALYARSLREKIRKGVGADDFEHPLKGLHIVVDAGNGAGGFFATEVLKPLGADIAGSQFLEPDGMFPNHIPNPEDKAAMASIREAVLASKADLGIIFDTDVDRMSAVLPDGSEVNRDAIIAMISAVIAPDYPGGTIVTDSVTSDRLTRFLEEELHLVHHRFKRGYKNVINESKRLNAEGTVSPLAIETSGHGALSENYFLDDGAYLAVKLLIALARAVREGKQLASYIEALPPAFEEREYRLKLQGEDFAAYGKEVLAAFEQRAKEAGYFVVPKSFEGIRLSFREGEIRGWLLLRMSLHDPLMPLNMEGDREGDCDRMVAAVKELLRGFDRLDLSSL